MSEAKVTMGATPKSRRERWNEICRQTKDCPHCPPHKKENERRKPRRDKHKNKREPMPKS